MKLISNCIIPICIAVLLLLFLYVVVSSTSLPDVYFSVTSGECVKVLQDGTDYDCNNLPSKYVKVWVR